MTTCPKPATGANSSMWYIPEVTCGVTPDTPEFKLLRRVTGNMQLNKDAITSEELDGSRDRANTRLGQNQTSGDVAIEMSYGSHDPFYTALIGSEWSAGATDAAVNVAVDATAKTYTRDVGDFTAIFSVGDLVRFPSLTGNNSEPVIATAVSALVITVDNVPNGFLEDEVSTATDVAQGDYTEIGDTCTSFTIVEKFDDLENVTSQYSITRGVKFVNLSYSTPSNDKATATFQTIGLTHEVDATLPAGSTFASDAITEFYSSVDASLNEGGVAAGIVTSADSTTDTEASAQFALGNDNVSFIEQGRVLSELSLSTYFKDWVLQKKFINEDETSLQIMLSNSDGALMFSYPYCKFTSGAPDVSGAASILQSITVNANQGPNQESSIKIQRISNA